MKGEIWKDIEGYEGLYQVSNMGRVKSLEKTVRNARGLYKKPERIMKPYDNGTGYLQIQLSKEGKSKNFYLHKLVAIAFCENLEGYKEINHIDENKLNNDISNLQLMTKYEHKCYHSSKPEDSLCAC